MMNEQAHPNVNHSTLPGDPRQFRIIDLFAVVTLAALLLAMAAPFVRAMTPASRKRLLVVVTCQLAVTAATMTYLAIRRAKLLQKSGRRIGIGYSGAIKWRHWPLFKSIAFMLFLAAAQLALALMYALLSTDDGQPPSFVIFQLQLGFSTGIALSRFKWGVYPSAVEFFDNGMSFGGTNFIGWDRSEVRTSQYLSDRVVIVMRQAKGSIAGETRTVQVPGSLREQLTATNSQQTSR
jgi:hypothetical protein